MTSLPGRSARRISALSVLAAALLFLPAAHALEEQRGEEAAIKACDKRLCTILMQKDPKGDDLRCSLTKTWARSTIKEADSHKLSWAFGDAQCTANINLSRARLVAALTDDQRKLRVPPHTVNCVVEQDGKLEKVTATLVSEDRISRTAKRKRSGSTSRTSRVRPGSRLHCRQPRNLPIRSACSTGA